MKLAVVSNVCGYRWAGSETLWHLAALQALVAGHEVTAVIHPDLAASEQVATFVRLGGRVRLWHKPKIARLQTLKECILPGFPASFLDSFDCILISLGSLPSLCYVPGLAMGLLHTRAHVVLLCQFNAGHLSITRQERDTVAAILRYCPCCVFVSRRNLEEARRQFAVDLAQAHVVGNPIRSILPEPLIWPDIDATAHFACVARLETAWKGQDLLLDVLSQVPWRERDWHLTFYGEGPDREHLGRLVELFNLSTRVTFAGFVSELTDIWARNQMLLLPSHGEGLPLSVLEAMMFGRPVVATDVGGNSEIIDNGINGFIAEAATARSFETALQRAWDTRERWIHMGRSAHTRACEVAKGDPASALVSFWLHAGAEVCVAPQIRSP
jgi:glycosyltransferase involved in cell wall biosynthesis